MKHTRSLEDWSPVSAKVGEAALVYSRRSRYTGHVVDIWDTQHDACPHPVKRVPGEGRFVAIDQYTGNTVRRDTWAAIYAQSRIVDGQPVPDSPYIAQYFD